MERRRTRKILKTVALSGAILLVLSGIAQADNVVNDVTGGGNDTITPGKSTTVNYKINANGGDGQHGCNAADGSAATLTINTPAGVTASPTSLTFTACNSNQSVSFSSSTVGSHSITHSITDSGVGTYSNHANWTLTVTPPPDTTPPAITKTITGTAGQNGWYTSDVSVTWSVTDLESSVTILSGCGTQSFTSEGTGLTSSCSASSTGGSASDSVSLKIDKTGPSATLTPSGTIGDNGWYRSNVEISTSGSDSLSDPTTCTALQTLSADTSGQEFNGSCTNAAGLTTHASPIEVKRDATAPTVTVTGVGNGSTYTLGSVPTAACDTTDATSGVATQATLSTSGGPVGSVAATCSGAKDQAGNVPAAATSVTYSVHYDFGGFLAPLNALPTRNTVKAGRAVPVKFSLGGDQGLSIFDGSAPKSSSTSCTPAGTDQVEEVSSAGSSSLSYDSLKDEYTYVWKTDSVWAGKCRTLYLNLKDGSTHKVDFNFTK